MLGNLLHNDFFKAARVVAALLACTLVIASSQPVQADGVLFTTQEDFTGWGGDATVAVQASPDLDGSTTNGIGGGGGPGTGGSLESSDPGDIGDYLFTYSPGQQGNAAFISALGISGNVVIDHTKPSDGSYFQLGAIFNYDGHFDQYFGAEVDNLDGTFTTTIPYFFTAGDVASYLQLGYILNSDADGAFTIDNIRLTNVVPEPATLGLAALCGLGLLVSRRVR